MNNYLNEAFKQLEMLNEEEFNLNDKDAVKDMKDFMGIDVDDSVEVIDPNAETEDDLEDSYVGKVILDCVVCHSKQYKDPNEVVIDDGELANVGEECPFCYTSDGFKVVGQVAPFDESDEDDDDQDEDDDYDEDEDDDSEFESWRNRIQECLKRLNEAGMSDEDKADSEVLRNIYQKTQKRSNAALTPDEKAVLAKYGLHRNPDFKNIGDEHGNSVFSHSSDRFSLYNDSNMANNPKVNLADRARKMGTRAQRNKELFASQNFNTDTTDEHDKTFLDSQKYQRRTNVANSAKMQNDVLAMKNALNSRNFANKELNSIDARAEDRRQKEINRHNDAMAAIDNDAKWRRKTYSDSKERNQKTIDKLLKRKTDESLERVEVETDDQVLSMSQDDTGKVTVSSTPVETTIVPVSDETQQDIELHTDDVNAEDAELNSENDALDIDDFDEQSFDELGEGYLKRVYENVDKYKTTAVKTSGKKLTVEGLITFKSGNTKNTQFIFEAKSNKNNSFKFVGENAQISRGKKSFAISGSLNNKQLVVESFNYNYRGKDSQTGKSVRLYGTLKRG